MSSSTLDLATQPGSQSNAVGNERLIQRLKRAYKKQIDEVKEVIQSKPDGDIVKVLDHYDYSVGKAIDAFVNGDDKQIIAEWSSFKSNKSHQHNENGDHTNISGDSVSKANQSKSANKNNNRNSSNKQQQQPQGKQGSNKSSKRQANNPNSLKINDLVASIIDQSIKTSSVTVSSSSTFNQTIEPSIVASSSPSSAYSYLNSNLVKILPSNYDEIEHHQDQQLTPGQQKQTQLMNSLNSSVSGGAFTNSNNIKNNLVTVIGIQPLSSGANSINSNTSSPAQTQSSVQSSPSSNSMMSSMSGVSSSFSQEANTNRQQSSQHQQLTSGRSSQFDILNNQPFINIQINKKLNNQNAKALLEKPAKDLQRQIVNLNKISSSYNDHVQKAQANIDEAYGKLRLALDERYKFLKSQIYISANDGDKLLKQRQAKANNLKYLADNGIHLTDQHTNELKAEIKHFVSERQLDEELLKVNLFEPLNFDKVNDLINQFGLVTQIKNNYSLQIPSLSSNGANATMMPINNPSVQHLMTSNSTFINGPISKQFEHNLSINNANKAHVNAQHQTQQFGNNMQNKLVNGHSLQQQQTHQIKQNGIDNNNNNKHLSNGNAANNMFNGLNGTAKVNDINENGDDAGFIQVTKKPRKLFAIVLLLIFYFNLSNIYVTIFI
jgi:hypothetical protein